MKTRKSTRNIMSGVITAIVIMAGVSIVNLFCAVSLTHAADDPADFDVRSLEWFQDNTGYDSTQLNPADDNTSNVRISSQSNPVTRNGLSLRLPSPLASCTGDTCLQLSINQADVKMSNAYFEGNVRVVDGDWQGDPARATIPEKGSVAIDHSTWGTYENMYPGTTGVMGMNLNLRFNQIRGRMDGIQPTGGASGRNIIEYNWIDGPRRYLYDGSNGAANHSDGIQFWREGNALIRRNRIEGWNNATILVGTGVDPRLMQPAGTRITEEPTSNIVIDENYFGSDGTVWYYLRVEPLVSADSEPWNERPRYITITNNVFESKTANPPAAYTDSANPQYVPGLTAQNRIWWPINTCGGSNSTEVAVFVRTEAEREEGIARQNAYPEVLEYREQRDDVDANAVDARSWIVWDNNRWAEDDSEIIPGGGACKESRSGWYDMSEERAAYYIGPTEDEEADDASDSSEDKLGVPNTGLFGTSGGAAVVVTTAFLTMIAAVLSTVVVVGYKIILKRRGKRRFRL